MVPKFKVMTEVKSRDLEETLNDLAKEGWELIPQTFKWDDSMRWANFLMIGAPSIGGVAPEPPAAPVAKAA